MAEQDALASFDMDQFAKPSIYLKFEPGKPVTVRVLTIDPIVYNNSFEDKRKGETVVQTKFAWIVFNFSLGKAQVMQTTPNLAKKLQELHVDPDFGANIRNIDLKITPPEAGTIAAYEVQVLPKAQAMSNEQIRAAMSLDLDKLFEDKNGMRINSYDPKKFKSADLDDGGAQSTGEGEDTTLLDDSEPINLDDIPF